MQTVLGTIFLAGHFVDQTSSFQSPMVSSKMYHLFDVKAILKQMTITLQHN